MWKVGERKPKTCSETSVGRKASPCWRVSLDPSARSRRHSLMMSFCANWWLRLRVFQNELSELLKRQEPTVPPQKVSHRQCRGCEGRTACTHNSSSCAAHGWPCPKPRCWEKDRCTYTAKPLSAKLQQKSFRERRSCSNNPSEHQQSARWCYMTRTRKWPGTTTNHAIACQLKRFNYLLE